METYSEKNNLCIFNWNWFFFRFLLHREILKLKKASIISQNLIKLLCHGESGIIKNQETKIKI